MAFTESPVSICNAALAKLTADPILTFSDGNDRSTNCGILWPIVRDEVLASKNWSPTYKRVVLSKDAATPAYDYAYQFKLEGDTFMVLSTDIPVGLRWTVEQGFLLCDISDDIGVLYIQKTEDTAKFGPLLIAALVSAMARELALPITGNKSLYDAYAAEAEIRLGTASQRDSTQRPNQTFSNNILTRVRR